jgi:hypothetical protein
MATESAKEWQQEAATMPFRGQVWWRIAMQRRAVLAQAQLQTQLAIASQMHYHLHQFQQNTAKRLDRVKEQLATYETPSESTPQSGGHDTMLLALIGKLADEGPVTSEKLNKALMDSGKSERPRGLLQAAINEFYLSRA